MSTKPTNLTPWATSANYPADAAPEAGTPTKVAFSLGQATIGDRPAGNPIAQQDNDWRYRVGLWNQYLSDGAFTGGISVLGGFTTDTIHVTGASTFDDTATFATDKGIQLAGPDGDVLHSGEYHLAFGPNPPGYMFKGPGSYTLTDTAEGGFSGWTKGNFTDAGASIRFPLVGLRPGDQIMRVYVAFRTAASIPQCIIRYGEPDASGSDSQGMTPTANLSDITDGTGTNPAHIFVQEHVPNAPARSIRLYKNTLGTGQLATFSPKFALLPQLVITNGSNDTDIIMIDVQYKRVATTLQP